MAAAAQAWTAPALASAVAVLVGAVCLGALQLARTYAQVINILEGLHRAGIPMRGSHATLSNTRVPATLAGAGASPPDRTIATAAWSQLSDQQMRGSASGAAAVDCGEECVAIAVQTIKHVPVPAEYIRWLWFGAYDLRLTSPDDLVGMLACVDIRSHKRLVAAATAQPELTTLLGAGQLGMVLGYWISPTERHWMVAVAAGPSGLTCRDPWTGTLRTISWPSFATLYSDAYVHVDQVVDIVQPRAA